MNCVEVERLPKLSPRAMNEVGLHDLIQPEREVVQAREPNAAGNHHDGG